MRGVLVFIYLLTLVVSSLELTACEDDSRLDRVYSDVDESSCICGLNNELLDKLELILNSSKTTCSITSSHVSNHVQQNQHSNRTDQDSNSLSGSKETEDREDKASSGSKDPSSPVQDNQVQQPSKNDDDDGQHSKTDNLADQIQLLQSQLASLMAISSSSSNNNKNPPKPESFSTVTSSSSSTSNPSSPYSPPSSSSNHDHYSRPPTTNQQSVYSQTNERPQFNEGHGQDNNNDNEQPKSPYDGHQINSGFLDGLPVNPATSESNVLSKLNHSQKVDTSDMQSALELTVPNVVSNIFSNIQNLTIETEKNPNGEGQADGQPDKLTSIDGSSINVSGSSSEQIQAQGEQLFVEWIDHQLQSLHLTASVAAYIHKNAILLFRRIVKQYVEQVEKLGGRVEDNVRRATQIALNNTQNLISFLLKNYLNFAGGLMRIIGEQVSRVGKQLDSTGETIAHINLNPFDIVSNVIDSLPNPSRYSEYFRAFGKYLMGESQSDQQASSQSTVGSGDSSSSQQSEGKKGGLFSKTMGALSKTLGSWLG